MEGIIPGIHQYCDRWCARCRFTTRCELFETQQSSPEGNAAFLQRLSTNFEKARDRIREVASQAGVDMVQLETSWQQAADAKAQLRKEVSVHPLVTLAEGYGQKSTAWLKVQPGMLDKLESLKKELTIGTEVPVEAREQITTIKDSLETIQWYAGYISERISAALLRKHSAGDDDPNGIAKSALRAIEDSLRCWQKLFEILPDHEDQFLPVLADLEKMRKGLVAEFPAAPSFVRPGLDEFLF